MPPKIITTTNSYNLDKAQNLIQLLYQTRADIEHRIDQLMDTEVDMEELPHVLSNISILVGSSVTAIDANIIADAPVTNSTFFPFIIIEFYT